MVPQHVDGFPLWIQGNVVTRHAFTLGVLGNEVSEEAFVARMRHRRLGEIEAGERILEPPRGRLGSTHGTSIASLLQKCEFELKSFKNVALLIGHGIPPPAVFHQHRFPTLVGPFSTPNISRMTKPITARIVKSPGKGRRQATRKGPFWSRTLSMPSTPAVWACLWHG